MDELLWEEQYEAAYADLSERERRICELVKQDFSWREIGDRLNLAEDTARMVYRRAVDRTRDKLLGGGNAGLTLTLGKTGNCPVHPFEIDP